MTAPAGAPVVIVTVAADGTITTRVVGGAGRSCRDATRALRDALGVTADDRALPEMRASAPTGARAKVGGGS